MLGFLYKLVCSDPPLLAFSLLWVCVMNGCGSLEKSLPFVQVSGSRQ